VDLHRDVPFGEGTKPGRFRLLYIREGLFPEAELFFIQQLTPEVLWQPELLDQPNAVTLLESVTVCSEHPQETAGRFQETTGAHPDTSGEGFRFRLARGAVEIVDPAALAHRFNGARPPAVPCLAAVTFGVSDRGRTRRCLEENGVPFAEDEGGIVVDAAHAAGAIARFV